MLRVTDNTQAIQVLSKLWMPEGQRVVIGGGGLISLELTAFMLAHGRVAAR